MRTDETDAALVSREPPGRHLPEAPGRGETARDGRGAATRSAACEDSAILARYFKMNSAAASFEQKLVREKSLGYSFEQRFLRNLKKKSKIKCPRSCGKGKGKEKEKETSSSASRAAEGATAAEACAPGSEKTRRAAAPDSADRRTKDFQNRRENPKKKCSSGKSKEKTRPASASKAAKDAAAAETEEKIAFVSERTRKTAPASAHRRAKQGAPHTDEDRVSAEDRPSATRPAPIRRCSRKRTAPAAGSERPARRGSNVSWGDLGNVKPARRGSDVSYGDPDDAPARPARRGSNVSWGDLEDALARAASSSMDASRGERGGEPACPYGADSGRVERRMSEGSARRRTSEESWGNLADVLERAKRESLKEACSSAAY